MSLSIGIQRFLEEDDHAGHDHAGHDDHDDHEEHDEHEEEEGGIDIDTFKIIMLLCMFFCIGFGLLPKLWGKCRDSENALSMLNCFSGGLFLGMSLIHLLPESAEIYLSWAAEEGIERPFPLPYVMFFVGYILILAIDRVAARAYHMSHDQKGKEDANPGAPINSSSIAS